MTVRLLPLLLLALSAQARFIHETDAEFRFKGSVEAGRAIEIKGVNGDVIAEPSTSGEVEVVALKRSPDGSHSEVRMAVMEHNGGATIQALHPAASGAEVEFRVRVPEGVRFVGRTANGRVEARQLKSPVDAETINGNIDIETSKPVHARAVNGSISARLDPSGDEGGSRLETVNGSVSVTLPHHARASIDAQTLYGSINSSGSLGKLQRPNHYRVRRGKPAVELRTVSGAITISSLRQPPRRGDACAQ
jgi:hypothetical protein